MRVTGATTALGLRRLAREDGGQADAGQRVDSRGRERAGVAGAADSRGAGGPALGHLPIGEQLVVLDGLGH